MAAIPAVADVMEQTDMPVVYYTESQDSYTITVEGDGVLTIQIYRQYSSEEGTSEELVVDVEAEGSYEYTEMRPYGWGHHLIVFATACEDGKMASEVAEVDITIAGYMVLPSPIISHYEEMDGSYIHVDNGQTPLMTVSIMVNEESFYQQETSESYIEVFVPRTYEEQAIRIEAVANGTGGYGWLPGVSEASYVLEAAEMPVAPMPEIMVQEEDECVIVSATGYGNVFLFKDWCEVSNPCVIERTDYDQYFEFAAYSDGGDNMQPSDYVFEQVFVEGIVPPPMEMTETPVITYEFGENETAVIWITNQDDDEAELIYSLSFSDEPFNNNSEYGEWLTYTSPITVSGVGYYLVRAQATVPGKLPSYEAAVEFVIVQSPVPVSYYDFEEGGVFYKITADDEVSVCCETTDYNSYSGQVVIPATVTHDGVTYMVTAVNARAFYNCVGLTEVSLGANLTDIGNNAFQGCTSLTSVVVPDYVITIGSQAFSGCSALATVKLGSGLASIDSGAFENCPVLTSVSCKAATPPAMAMINCFECYDTATLYVYPAVLKKYKAIDFWKRFANIVPESSVAPSSGDTNGDGILDITDITILISKVLTGN